MKRFLSILALSQVLGLLISCGGGGSVSMYHRSHGPSPWWGAGGYYRDRVIVPPPDLEPEFEATPVPSGPDDGFPGMGRPDIDFD